jgi:hypothetical protein
MLHSTLPHVGQWDLNQTGARHQPPAHYILGGHFESHRAFQMADSGLKPRSAALACDEHRNGGQPHKIFNFASNLTYSSGYQICNYFDHRYYSVYFFGNISQSRSNSCGIIPSPLRRWLIGFPKGKAVSIANSKVWRKDLIFGHAHPFCVKTREILVIFSYIM